jgi:hypothetical protein
MWLDAFVKKSGNTLKVGVLGVPGVPLPSKANDYKDLAGTPSGNTANNSGVPGVPEDQPGTPGTPRNTSIKLGCSSVLPPRKANEYKGLAFSGTPGTPGTPEKHHAQEISDALQLFRFDLVQQEIEGGYPADELRRVNNMAWRLMTAQGFGFDEAIKAAAEWVISSPAHQDEATMIDVMELFKGLMQ